MALDSDLYRKVLTLPRVSKLASTFDRNMASILGISWGVALAIMVLAIYVTMMSASMRRAANNAMDVEPALPIINHGGVSPAEMQALMDRMAHRYPELGFTLRDRAMTVTAVDGTRFRQWLNALSYVDTVSPQLHWTIQDLCVGKCSGSDPMRATVIAERVTFDVPAGDANK